MDAEQLRELRGNLGLTQQEMAQALNVSFVTYNRWENEHRHIPGEVKKLLQAIQAMIAHDEDHAQPLDVEDISEALKRVGARGVLSAAAVRRLLPARVIASLSTVPSFAWIGGILGMAGLGALSFFAKSNGKENDSSGSQ